MRKLEEIQDKIFIEAKNFIENISEISTKEELVARQDLFYAITERIAVLKTLARYDIENVQDNNSEEITSDEFLSEENAEVDEYFDTEIEEEVRFDHNLAELEETNLEGENNDEPQKEDIQLNEVEEVSNAAEIIENYSDESSLQDIDNQPISIDSGNEKILQEAESEALIEESTWNREAYEHNVSILEKQFEKTTDHQQHDLRKINEFSPVHNEPEPENQPKESEHHKKKIKLAHIKGLNKNIQSLFDSDPLEHVEIQEDKTIHKSNMPTSYMEAEKPKKDFKLDLNDRIAFTKELFGGSQTELNEAIKILNSFKSVDEAKEYLSDLYYQKNWKKSDDYAQRLWALVENKF